MSTILETQVATKKLKKKKTRNSKMEEIKMGNLLATTLASTVPRDAWGSQWMAGRFA